MATSVPENIDVDTPVFVPTHPFVQTTAADTILRSRDDHAQPPQPRTTSVAPATVNMEDSVTLDRILRFFYPATQPRVETLDELEKIIERVPVVITNPVSFSQNQSRTHLLEFLNSCPFNYGSHASPS
ncbi:hypothetical protein B0H13DRAFT_2327781 [Mycena leptocephala]|nr:hypothetical protein B0H13DRAFT_2327781 [Mycena leptocephala]